MNKVFQFVWYKFWKGFTPRKKDKGTGILLDDYSDRFFSQLNLAEKFGDVDLVIIGDSNGEELSDYESMKRFPKLSVNFAIGGTRADHWRDFFKGKIGSELLKRIQGKKILINVGGNNVLQGQMEVLQGSLFYLEQIFPNAYWINIPSIYASLIADILGRPLLAIEKELKWANDMIADVAGDRLIDIRPFTGSNEVKPYFFVLKDLVHYSDVFDQKVRIPLILARVYGK